MILHEVSVKESRTIMGNIFQPYHKVEDIQVPSFLLVCRNGAQSDLAALFIQKGYPVLNTAHFKLPAKKETEAFVREFMGDHLRRQREA